MNHYTILFDEHFWHETKVIATYDNFMDAYARVKREYLERDLLPYEEEMNNGEETIITTFFKDEYEGEEWYQTWTIKKNFHK